MLDIRFIRENHEVVAQNTLNKGYSVDIEKLLKLDEQRRQLLSDIEAIRAERNELAAAAKSKKPSPTNIQKGKKLKDQLAASEKKLEPVEADYLSLLKAVPNMALDDVPIGASEEENIAGPVKGNKPKFDFGAKTHWQLAEQRGLIDKERAARVSGSRFAYIKGDLVKLQFAIIQFVIDKLTDEKELAKIAKAANLKVSTKPFIPVLPPLMLRTEVFDAMDRLEPRDERYKVGSDEDNLWLQGSAEHTLGSMHINETLDGADLPLRYLGYATSFRREAGTYGKDTEGIIRMHQFDKLEMESLTSASAGLGEHLFMVAIQEHIMRELGLPYRVIKKCTADIGKPNARGIDLEVWLTGNQRFLETHTADYMSDYQARRLSTKVKGGKFVHSNDATAVALGRIMVGIIENYQTKAGKIAVPIALQPYMQGQTEI